MKIKLNKNSAVPLLCALCLILFLGLSKHDLYGKDVNQTSDIDEKNAEIFKVGEKITYEVKLLKMKSPMALDNGKVTFEIGMGTVNNKDCYIFQGSAEGVGFGYNLRIDTESFIDKSSFRPLLFTHIQTGSEDRKKKLIFSEKKIEYLKMKHCKSDGKCHDDSHFTFKNDAKVHCEGCKDRNHYVWRVRAIHKNKKPTYDLLSALFIARTFDLKYGGKDYDIILADDRDLWKMRIHVVSEEIVETKIGKFDTLLLKLTGSPINGHAKQQKIFTGLFGLKGDMRLWVEKETKIPIRIMGTYPFLFDVPIEILITSVEGIDKLSNM
ncbi:MAG: DUF3108 domain-containing protein [Candidatus Anammoxibacter sp.]